MIGIINDLFHFCTTTVSPIRDHQVLILKWKMILDHHIVVYRNLKFCFYLFQYLTKQTSTLREVNDSRVKIYEQLEVSISDLETTNNKLMEENLNDKVKIKRYVLA